MTSSSRLGGTEAKSLLAQQAAHDVLGLVFTKCQDYTTFDVEFCVQAGDLIFHFYATKEVNALVDPKKYWLEVFPETLSAVALSVFKVPYPTVRAAYTEEKASWWLRADGQGHVLDPHKRIYVFLDTLDAALETRM